jgi:hypothetical protein
MHVRNLERTLASPQDWHSVMAITTDMIWKTCCALHNWLLEVDGLDEQWDQGVQSHGKVNLECFIRKIWN